MNPASHQQLVDKLRQGLVRESGFVKVHAAEFLLKLGYPQNVHEVFQEEEALQGQTPGYRIGIWRVLAQSSPSAAQRQTYKQKIIEVATDPQAEDRLFAVESMGKLGVVPDKEDAQNILDWARQAAPADVAFACWPLLLSSDAQVNAHAVQAELARLLEHDNPLARLRAAYVLSSLKDLLEPARQALLHAGLAVSKQESADPMTQLAAAHVASGKPVPRQTLVKPELIVRNSSR